MCVYAHYICINFLLNLSVQGLINEYLVVSTYFIFDLVISQLVLMISLHATPFILYYKFSKKLYIKIMHIKNFNIKNSFYLYPRYNCLDLI